MKVRVGMEASGHARWFERLLAELNIELWMATPPRSIGSGNAKQKTDRQDAQHILRLLLKDDFHRSGYRAGESRFAATVVATGTACAGAHADDEPVASGGTE